MDNESDNHTSYLFYGFLLLVFGDEDDAVTISDLWRLVVGGERWDSRSALWFKDAAYVFVWEKIELMNDRFQSRINPSKNVSSLVEMCFRKLLSPQNGQHKIWKIIFLVFVSKEQGRRERERCIEINYINYDIEKEHHQSSLSIEEEKRSRVILSLSPYCLLRLLNSLISVFVVFTFFCCCSCWDWLLFKEDTKRTKRTKDEKNQ